MNYLPGAECEASKRTAMAKLILNSEPFATLLNSDA